MTSDLTEYSKIYQPRENNLREQDASENCSSKTVREKLSIITESTSVIANVSNGLLGVGIFAMPWGFQQSGTLGGTMITLFLAYLSFDTLCILLETQKTLFIKKGEVYSYPEVAQLILGSNTWGSIVKIATVISCLGSCIGYFIFLGEICGQLFAVSISEAVLIVILPLILLSWIRSFRELTLFTFIGVVAIIATIIAVTFDHITNLNEKNFVTTPLFIPETALNFLGPATFSFTIHYCVLAMGAELLLEQSIQQNSTKYSSIESVYSDSDQIVDLESRVNVNLNGLIKALGVAFVLSALIIVFHGSTAFIIYRNANLVLDKSGSIEAGCEESVCQNIILNLSQGPVRTIIGVVLCVAIVLSYVFILAPAREHVETSLLIYFKPCSDFSKMILKNGVRSVLVLFTAFVAIHSPYFGTVLGRVGGLTDAFQAFVVPSLIYLRVAVSAPGSGRYQSYYYYFVLVWGIVTIVYTLFQLFVS